VPPSLYAGKNAEMPGPVVDIRRPYSVCSAAKL
jgi:hypothetical protein